VRAGRDIPHVSGRGFFQLRAAPAMNRIGALRRFQPAMTLREFGR
jgi:hypothetical protein